MEEAQEDELIGHACKDREAVREIMEELELEAAQKELKKNTKKA